MALRDPIYILKILACIKYDQLLDITIVRYKNAPMHSIYYLKYEDIMAIIKDTIFW